MSAVKEKLKIRSEPLTAILKEAIRQAANVERELWEDLKGRSMSLTGVMNEVKGKKHGFDGGSE